MTLVIINIINKKKTWCYIINEAMYKPFEEVSKRSKEESSNSITVYSKSEVVHPLVKGSLGQYCLACKSKLQENDSHIWLCSLHVHLQLTLYFVLLVIHSLFCYVRCSCYMRMRYNCIYIAYLLILLIYHILNYLQTHAVCFIYIYA